MAIYNPLYNDETGWAAMDQLTPQQQAFMNPAAFGGGYGMNVGAANNPANTYGQFTGYQGGSQLPAGYDPYAVSNGVAGMNFQFPSGSNLGGGGDNFMSLYPGMQNPVETMSGIQGVQGGSQNPQYNPVGGMPTLTPSGWNNSPSPVNPISTSNAAMGNFGTTNNSTNSTNSTPVSGSPSLATNMGMQGAESVGGVGMYTGANAPLNLSLFTPSNNSAPNGPPPGSIPTGDPNTWITPWGATYTTPGSVNNQTSADYDAWRQRAFGNIMGPQGKGPNTNPYSELTDALVRQRGSINAQTFQGYLSSLQHGNAQTLQGYLSSLQQPQQQTGPQNPPSAPTPQPGRAQSQPLPGSDMQSTYQNLIQQGYSPQQAQQFIQQLSMPTPPGAIGSMRADPYRNFESNNPGQPGYNPNFGSGNYGGPQTPVIGSPGMMGQGNNNPSASNAAGPSYPGLSGPLYYVPNEDPYSQVLRTSRTPLFPGQQPMGQDPNNPYGWSPGQNGWNPQPASQPNWNDLTDYGRQQMGMPTAQQWEQMRGGTQSPMTIASYGLPQTTGGGNPSDYRAATYGTQPQNTAPAGGSGSIPNTTNPLNPLTSQTQYRAPGFGSATNRLAGFGNTSLFGTPYGSGGSTGFGGTNPSQYRGAGMYGRAASYGQSQRPY